jgi:hypothetical protein
MAADIIRPVHGSCIDRTTVHSLTVLLPAWIKTNVRCLLPTSFTCAAIDELWHSAAAIITAEFDAKCINQRSNMRILTYTKIV